MRRRQSWPIFACALAAGLIATPGFAAKPLRPPETTERIEIRALPFDLDRQDPNRARFGKLEWRGGLALSSNARHFGGFSGLALSPDGDRLLAISDAGVWLEAEIDRDGRKLRGLTDARLGPILALNGQPFARTRDIDAESLAAADGTVWIGFEQNHRIMRHVHRWGGDGPGRASERIAPPNGFRGGGGNFGLEALGVLIAGPLKGGLATFSESRVNGAGDHRGWIIAQSRSIPLTLKRIGGFDLTGAAGLPDGGLILLERRFRFSEGVQMRIRRIRPEELLSERTIDGEVLLELDGRAAIDNMEGIAVTETPNGETILTLISDDNFNRFFQRTLLMQFALTD